MNTFFKSLILDRDKLSTLEKQVLNYMLEKPEQVENHTLEELSQMMFVSTATISRTCKKLGFSGFQELKFALSNHRENNPKESQNIQFSSVGKHLERFNEEMTLNIEKIGTGINKEVIELIINSNHIEFFGVGSSLPVCIEGARKMTFAGRIATARSDWDELRVVAQNLTPNDLAIVVSLSGETLHIIEYANILKNRDVPILTISGNEESHLDEFATCSLNAQLQPHYYQDIDMSSRFPLNMIIDLIVLEYLKYINK